MRRRRSTSAAQSTPRSSRAGSSRSPKPAARRKQRGDGSLEFAVRDDGRGFDAAAVSYGTGLQGIADRLDAIGGTLTVESEPGRGTTIRGAVPVV
jgi:signal transduction histidine kinase